VKLGELEVIPVSDGTCKLPPQYFVNADWSAHQDLFGPDGMIECQIGCFVVRTGDTTVLIDAGVGPFDNFAFQGGKLPGALEVAGVSREEIDLVVCTHLHLDHTGWLVRDEQRFFPNATVRFGAADWDHFVVKGKSGDMVKDEFELLAGADRLRPIEVDGEAIAAGITARHAPGHTLGHYCLVLSSGDERALLLGDAIACPVQLEEPDWQAMSDVDPALAVRTREALFRELEASGDLAVAAHFPELKFGRVLLGQGARYWS
jgi:glyoxylase-like metal-dependent hydrolase (beta-lactamase superfamily II)